MVDLFVTEDNLLGTPTEYATDPIVITESNLVGTGTLGGTDFILVVENNLLPDPEGTEVEVSAGGNSVRLLTQGLI